MSDYDPKRARTKQAVPLWADALLRDTLDLEADEFGAFHFLIYAMWARPSLTLPDNDRKLAKICRVSTRLWRSRLRDAMEQIFDVRDGEWHNRRLRREADKTEAFLMSQSRRAHGFGVDDRQDQFDLDADREPPPAPPPEPAPEDTLFRRNLISAAGVKPAKAARFAGPAEMVEAHRWITDLHLTEAQVVAEVSRIAQSKGTDAPETLKYFSKAMQRLAGSIQQARERELAPDVQEHSGQGKFSAGGKSTAHDGLVSGFAGALSARQR